MTCILRETGAWIAADKPSGVVVVPARREAAVASLWRTLERERGERLFVVHRLDRDTSGVVLFARSAETHRLLCGAMERGEVRKTYLALVHGSLEAEEGVVEVPLHAARKGKTRPAAADEPGARKAVTAYRVLRRYATPIGPVSWVEASPRTGRLHQIRVHFRFAGAPLLVDPLYSRRSRILASDLGARDASFVVERLTLHAARVGFRDPISGEPVLVESPLPEDLGRLLAVLEVSG